MIKALHEKHPEKSEASVTILEQLATSPPPSIDPIIFEAFLPGGSFLLSKEGTTHGNNAASGFYSLGVTPLVKAMFPNLVCR